MTSDKRRKARIRARMAKTGERYTTARRHVVGADPPMPTVLGYELRGGLHPDAAVVANVLANSGVTGPDNAPLSEAVVFGVMGGLGAGYILWEFSGRRGRSTASLVEPGSTESAHDDSRVVTLGFRNQWQYHDRGVRAALDRLGVPYDRQTTSGARTAARHLDVPLDAGRPAVVWPDRGVLGYWQLPSDLSGHGGHPVVVIGRDGDRIQLDDRGSAPLTVTREVLDRARARVGSYKNLLIDPLPDGMMITAGRLRTAISAGIDDCTGQMLGTSTSFALPAWRRWGRLMTAAGDAKGWRQVFDDRVGLCGALLSVWEATSASGMTGGHLRGLYADFLTEVGPTVGIDVGDVVHGLRDAAELWTQLGSIAIGVEDQLCHLRDLTVTVRQCVAGDGDGGADEAAAAGTELWKRRAALDAECPLAPDAVEQRFSEMGDTLLRIHDVESRALSGLAAVRQQLERP